VRHELEAKIIVTGKVLLDVIDRARERGDRITVNTVERHITLDNKELLEGIINDYQGLADDDKIIFFILLYGEMHASIDADLDRVNMAKIIDLKIWIAKLITTSTVLAVATIFVVNEITGQSFDINIFSKLWSMLKLLF
jgi:hypothetical protein